MAHLKGQNVNLLTKVGNSYVPIAASRSCDLTITANTEDAAAKDDPGDGMFDNPDFVNYSWSASNESYVVDVAYLGTLLSKVLSGDRKLEVQFQVGGKGGSQKKALTKKGEAFISNISIDATNGSFATINLSLDGNGTLSDGTFVESTTVSELKKRIKGKALMVAIDTSTQPQSHVWKTIACATSHKLNISVNLSDITDKDYNDSAVYKEATGITVSLTTDNLIDDIANTATLHGAGLSDLYSLVTTGKAIAVEFGYYPDSIGSDVHQYGAGTGAGYAEGDTVLITGIFTCTNVSVNGANKEDATFSAEFQNKGAVTVSAAAAAALSEE